MGAGGEQGVGVTAAAVDAEAEWKAARAAEIDCVCVSYGYNHGQPIRDSQPAYLIDAMPELLPLLGLEDGG